MTTIPADKRHASSIITEWNETHDIGAPVLIIFPGQVIETRTRSDAYLHVNGRAVVLVEGSTLCYLLNRIVPVAARAPHRIVAVAAPSSESVEPVKPERRARRRKAGQQ
jgi:hypothetical protein